MSKIIFKSLFIILLFISMVLFTSCSSINSLGSNKANTEIDQIGGFVGGVQGLGINLIDGAPPDVVQDAGLTPFSLIVALENLGEAPVGKGTENPLVFVRLAGILHSNFNLQEKNAIKVLDVKLESAKRNFDGTIIPGEIIHFGYDNLNYLPDVFDSLALTLRAEVCYDYETYTSVKFCMKSDIVEHVEDSTICNLRGPRPFGNSGAPLQVTQVEQAPINENTVQINFVIEHLGNGVFFDRHEYTDLFDVCVFDDMNPHIYKTKVIVEPIQKDEYEIECLRLDNKLPGGGVSGIVRLYRGAPLSVSCFIKNKPDSAKDGIKSIEKSNSPRIQQDLLDIKLQYRYADFIEKPILIQGHP